MYNVLMIRKLIRRQTLNRLHHEPLSYFQRMYDYNKDSGEIHCVSQCTYDKITSYSHDMIFQWENGRMLLLKYL